MEQILGAYPGGPTRPDQLEQVESNEAPRALRRGEDHERRAGLRSRSERIKSRRVRVVLGVGATLIVSAAAGIYWGFSASRNSDEALERARVRVNRSEVDVSREMDRLIEELWKMEDMDRMPRRLPP